VSTPDGLALVRAVRDALGTAEGRRLARELAHELQRAADEAAERDPTGTYADELLTRARRADRRRRGDASR
jgi:hypothetical protein